MKNKRKKRQKLQHLMENMIFYTSCINNPNQFEYGKIIDILYWDKRTYILVEAVNVLYIYQIVGISKYSYVTAQTIRKYRKIFEEPSNWRKKTILRLNEENVIGIK